MSRPAGALLVNWLDLDEGAEPEFEHWHNGEHAAERVGLPGFLSCRRYVSAEAAPPPGFGRLIVYEAAKLDAFASAAYRQRLDRPTALTKEIVPRLRRVSRAILSVETGWRNGLGTWLACTAFEDRPDDSLLRIRIEEIAARPVVTGVTYASAVSETMDAKTGTAEAGATESIGRRVSACLLVEASARSGMDEAADTVRRDFGSAVAATRLYGLSFVLEA